MKRSLRLLFSTSMVALLVATYLPNNIFAEYTNFNITSNWKYSEVSSANTKMDTNQTAYVEWNYSSDKNPHNQWFQIVNSDLHKRSEEAFFSYKSNGYINEENCQKGYYYYLRARREHIINPETTVSGNWES